jgi:hypothetical protein
VSIGRATAQYSFKSVSLGTYQLIAVSRRLQQRPRTRAASGSVSSF